MGWDWRCLCVLARRCLTGVLPSASRPCQTHFFVASLPASPNNKKRLPFGNLLLLLERAMGSTPFFIKALILLAFAFCLGLGFNQMHHKLHHLNLLNIL